MCSHIRNMSYASKEHFFKCTVVIRLHTVVCNTADVVAELTVCGCMFVSFQEKMTISDYKPLMHSTKHKLCY